MGKIRNPYVFLTSVADPHHKDADPDPLVFFTLIRILPFSVAYPGSGAFLTPGSGIRNGFIPDPGSQALIFESLVTTFWVKSFIIL
jgi:hypothetical protein